MASRPSRLAQVAVMAANAIRRGRLQRSMALLTALGAVGNTFEASVSHLQGAYRSRWMWTPVIIAPITAAVASVAVVNERFARSALPWASLVLFADGLAGFLLHIRGIRRMPGGPKMDSYSITMGPPLFAPLLLGSVGFFGLLAALLPRPPAHEEFNVLSPQASRTLRIPRTGSLPGVRPGDGAARSPVAARARRKTFRCGMALLAGYFCLFSSIEAYFEHRRGSYNQRWMWTPVLLGLPMVASAAGAVVGRRTTRPVLPWISGVMLLDGLLGFLLHLRGVQRKPGHWRNLAFNVISGPPLFAPFLFAIVGLLGLAAAVGRERS